MPYPHPHPLVPYTPSRVTGSSDDHLLPAVLSVKDAAQYLGMSESWLWRSDVPRVRLGSRVKFRVVDLDAYLVQRVSHGAAA
jgi:predicted DNA-binding transcriptional regulator AlpA